MAMGRPKAKLVLSVEQREQLENLARLPRFAVNFSKSRVVVTFNFLSVLNPDC